MYRIDWASNNIVKLDQKQFKDLRILEREHLQEWIANNPEHIQGMIWFLNIAN